MTILNKHNKVQKRTMSQRLRKFNRNISKHSWLLILVLMLLFFVGMGIKSTADALAEWHYKDVVSNYSTVVHTVSASNLSQ